jgi:RHS repeat-associated protein
MMNYTPYGYAGGVTNAGLHLGFTGQLLLGSFYLLGDGHRAYSTRLMRFVSSDKFSPFDMGGLNSYAYCEGDPVNFVDPSGRGKMPNLTPALDDVPNPLSNKMPDLKREPDPIHQTKSYKQWMLKKRVAWSLRTDYAAKMRDRRARTYQQVDNNNFIDISQGAQPITRAERVELKGYENSNRRMVGLTVPESKALRGVVLDALVSDQNQPLEVGVVTAAIRHYFDGLPKARNYTLGDLCSVQASVRGVVMRNRKNRPL